MNEAETRAELIDPALKAAGWGVVDGSRVRREYPIAPGRIEGAGKRGKALTADYILEYRNTKLAVVEVEVAGFPSPDELWARLYATKNVWRDRFATVPFEDKGGYFQGRYYQDIAIARVLEAIAEPIEPECRNPIGVGVSRRKRGKPRRITCRLKSEGEVRRRQGAHHPAHDFNELLASGWHADVGTAVHGGAVRQVAGVFPGRSGVAAAVG